LTLHNDSTTDITIISVFKPYNLFLSGINSHLFLIFHVWHLNLSKIPLIIFYDRFTTLPSKYLIVFPGASCKLCFRQGKLSVGKYMTILFLCFYKFFGACSAVRRVKQDSYVLLITHPGSSSGPIWMTAKGKLSLRRLVDLDD